MAKTEIRYCPQCYLSRRFVDGVCAVCEYVIPGWGETTVIYDPPIRYEAGKGTIGYPCGFANSMKWGIDASYIDYETGKKVNRKITLSDDGRSQWIETSYEIEWTETE